jgi:hypothetical protein
MPAGVASCVDVPRGPDAHGCAGVRDTGPLRALRLAHRSIPHRVGRRRRNHLRVVPGTVGYEGGVFRFYRSGGGLLLWRYPMVLKSTRAKGQAGLSRPAAASLWGPRAHPLRAVPPRRSSSGGPGSGAPAGHRPTEARISHCPAHFARFRPHAVTSFALSVRYCWIHKGARRRATRNWAPELFGANGAPDPTAKPVGRFVPAKRSRLETRARRCWRWGGRPWRAKWRLFAPISALSLGCLGDGVSSWDRAGPDSTCRRAVPGPITWPRAGMAVEGRWEEFGPVGCGIRIRQPIGREGRRPVEQHADRRKGGPRPCEGPHRR